MLTAEHARTLLAFFPPQHRSNQAEDGNDSHSGNGSSVSNYMLRLHTFFGEASPKITNDGLQALLRCSVHLQAPCIPLFHLLLLFGCPHNAVAQSLHIAGNSNISDVSLDELVLRRSHTTHLVQIDIRLAD